MLLGEPPPTKGDLFFVLFGFPVRVHPLFWLMGLILGFPPFGHAGGPRELLEILVPWMAAFFLAILVHELGHAVVMRWYGYGPSITLFGLGGFASYGQLGDYRTRGSRTVSQVIISLAGPGAGFLLAGFVYGSVWATALALHQPVSFDVGPRLFGVFLSHLFWISVIWGILNLMPVYPLDGGKISRDICLAINAAKGIRWSLILSMAAGTVLAIVGFNRGNLLMAFLFGYLAYSSYATLQAYSRGRRH